ncbi:olfactory receptor 52N5-like [Cebidichthys violaceus]|uniref:olfactory receptor 52N5-like n=1 Tax=Cebidichthys violaceus TaxID=271503 RepID=UPI0035C9CA91
MENSTFGGEILTLERLKLTSQSFIPAFVLLLLVYIFIVVSNIGLVVLIFKSRSLHQPMYLLFCNMSINDLFGATIIVPHLLRDLLLSDSERFICYTDCAVQAFCVHLHASVSHTVLMIMAFDRYVAICSPLRYASIMTGRTVAALSAAAWTAALLMVAILVGLSVRLSRCRSVVSNLFCDNASLFKLSCESVLVNNIYGLGYTVVLLGSSIGSVTLTYLKIAVVCLSSRNKSLNGKALQTCTTHLAVYVFLLVSGFIIVTLHRFPQLADHRKVAAVMGHVVLPVLNGVIYGLQIKEVRQRIMALFHNNKVALMDV